MTGGANGAGGTNGLGAGGGTKTGGGAKTGAEAATCSPRLPRFAFFFASISASLAALTAFSSASFAFFFASCSARRSAFLSTLVVGAATVGAELKGVDAAPTPNGLFGDVNALGAESNWIPAGSDVAAVVGASGAGAWGAKENGEFGELKIEGTVDCGGAGAGGGGAAGSGVVKGSGYCGMVLAASENGFGCWLG